MIFLPAAYVTFLALYGQLQADDYSVVLPGGFGWFPCCCADNTMCGQAVVEEEDDTGRGKNGGGEDDASDGP